tara:strand:- start:1007 stop:1582 length:576 start_codon:yes stop_codon:yes gene_type:complete
MEPFSYLVIVGLREKGLFNYKILKMKRYIAYYEGENNYYNDSDFYTMLIDTKEKKVIKHVWGSTRFAGSVEFPHEYDDVRSDLKEVEKYEKLATEYAVNEVPKRLARFDYEEGDVVKVTNPRVRKFKGETFKIEEIKKFKRFGRVVSETLIGINETGETIQTSASNVEIVKHGLYKTLRVARRIVVGLSVN